MTLPIRCSVILPTHNRLSTLPRAVASVLRQDMPDFELLIVDDASTDGTMDWLKTQNDPRIQVLRSDRNVGPGAARNLALAEARADLVAFLDSDDSYLPNRLSVPLKALQAEPDVVCTMSSSEKHNWDRTQIAVQPDLKLTPAAFRWALICSLIGVESSSITARTSAARMAGGFCPKLLRDEDGEFLIRLSALGALRLLPDVLWQKFWSTNGLSQMAMANAGRDLLRYIEQRPEFVHEYQKIGSYRATKALVADLRHRRFMAFLSDLRQFRAAGLVKGGPLRLWRVHREVRKYRRKMMKREELACLTGPPDSWT